MADEVTGVANTKASFSIAGAIRAADAMIAVAAMFDDALNVTAAVRSAKFAFCVLPAVVIPDATVTVHATPAARSALVDVSVSFAPVAPELASPAVNCVDPQPLVDGVARLARVKDGKTMLMTSPEVRTAFNAKRTDTDVADEVTGVAITRRL